MNGKKPMAEEPKHLNGCVRDLREDMTPEQIAIWDDLEDGDLCGFIFEFNHKLENYTVDFYCAETRVVVETYNLFLRTRDEESSDIAKDAHLTALGYMVLRFSTYEIVEFQHMVMLEIFDACMMRLDYDDSSDLPRLS